MPTVYVAGSLNMDVIARVDAFPGPGQTLIGNSLATLPGGKGLNQAVAARRSGANVAFYGCLGNDAFGHELRKFAAAEGIDISHIGTTTAAATGTAIITVAEKGGENNIVVVPGANHQLFPSDLSPPLWHGTAADVLLMQFEIPIPTVTAALANARAAGTLTILNASPAMPSAIALLQQTDVVIVNEDELAAYAGLPLAAVSEPEQIAKIAARFCSGPKQAWVITLGRRGAMVVKASGEPLLVPGFSVKAVDTTGAGDCFAGALAASLANRHDWSAALQYANAAAALSVTKTGAAPSMPLAADVHAWLASQPA